MRKLAATMALVLAACGGGGSPTADTATSGDVARGEQAYATHCAVCHGPAADGGDLGPPLVDDVYRPGHHGDGAFRVAVLRGVAQHHWDFGPMPAVPGLSDEDIAAITAYVRQLQRAAGIE